MSRTLLGRFLFEEVELLQVLTSTGRLVGLMSGCKIGPGAPSTKRREIQGGKVANVLIGIGAILIAITRMMKGLVTNFELSAACCQRHATFDRGRGIVRLNLHD
jgi:hypothetical protein